MHVRHRLLQRLPQDGGQLRDHPQRLLLLGLQDKLPLGGCLDLDLCQNGEKKLLNLISSSKGKIKLTVFFLINCSYCNCLRGQTLSFPKISYIHSLCTQNFLANFAYLVAFLTTHFLQMAPSFFKHYKMSHWELLSVLSVSQNYPLSKNSSSTLKPNLRK